MPEWRDTLFKGRPKIGLDFFNAPRQRGNRTKCLVHSMGYGLCVDVQKSGTTQIQNVLDKGYNLIAFNSFSSSSFIAFRLLNSCTFFSSSFFVIISISFSYLVLVYSPSGIFLAIGTPD